MLGRESNHGPEVWWAFQEKPYGVLVQSCSPGPGCAAHLLPISGQLAATRAAAGTGRPRKLHRICSFSVYLWTCTWLVIGECSMSSFAHLKRIWYTINWRWFTCTGVLLLQISVFLKGLWFVLQGFLAHFSTYGQRVYEAMKWAWKHFTFPGSLMWIVNACICIFRASH